MESVVNRRFEDWLAGDLLRPTIEALEVSFDRDSGRIGGQLEVLVGQLEKGPFGKYLIGRVENCSTFPRKSGGNMFRMEAVVMQPDGEGYIECEHPLKRGTPWRISSVIPEEKLQELGLQELIHEGDLFKAKYVSQNSPQRYDRLITCELHTYEGIEQSVKEHLMHTYGRLLYDQFMGENRLELGAKEIALSHILKVADDVYEDLQEQRESIQERHDRLKEEREVIEREEENLTETARDWRAVFDKIKHYDRLLEEEEGVDTREKHEWDEETAIDILQKLIFYSSEDRLIYEKQLIGMLIRSLRVNALTILSGPSGTGKSSIVEALGKVLCDTVVKVIPVQSSWTDTEDLLGYFNPVEKSFVASPFMEALADARSDELKGKERLHIICLDEMNLAHVEYYFSEFLSAREATNPALRLYNKRYFYNAKRFIEDANEDAVLTDAYGYASDLVELYPYLFEIPENVRFVGTLNMDHTVKPLSPKVIDRSFRIELGKLDVKTRNTLRAELEEEVIEGCLKTDKFFTPIQTEDVVADEVALILELSNLLEAIPDASLNSRSESQMKTYLAYTKESIRTLESDAIRQYIDELILMKLLPRIEVSRQEEEANLVLSELQNELETYPLSRRKMTEMMEKKPIISF